MLKKMFLSVLFGVMAAACTGQTPSPEPTTTDLPTTTTEATPTATPRPTITPRPTNTPRPSPPPFEPETIPAEITFDASLLGENIIVSEEVIAYASGLLDVAPAVRRYWLQGYPVESELRATIHVVSISELERAERAGSYTYLEETLANRPTLAATVPFAENGDIVLPAILNLGAGQVFAAQAAYVGQGLRFVTLYAQYYAMPNSNGMFVRYGGIDEENRTVIDAILPVRHPSLPDRDPTINPLNDSDYPGFLDNYGEYVIPMVESLDEQPPESFSPALGAIDAFIESIRVDP